MDVDRGSGTSSTQGPTGGHDDHAAGQEEEGAGQLYVDVVGMVPENFTPGAREAWDREQARGWVTTTSAHASFRAIDGPMVGNSFRKQMAKLPEARVPMRADRANSITVVRHSGEVGYVTRYKEVRAKMEQLGSPMPMAPMAQYVIAAFPFLDHDCFQADPKDLVTNRHHRYKMGFLVDYHQQEFPSCPVGVRALHYVRVPHWFKGVDIPFGSVVALPVVHCYFRDMLRANDLFTWNVFKSEWAVTAGVFLLNEALCVARAWLYSRTLRTWIRRVTPEFICQNRDGPVAAAARDLKALLDLLDQVTPVAGLEARLLHERGPDRTRSTWIKVSFESVDGVWSAVVHEDLTPLALPYSSDVLESRAMLAGDCDAGPADHPGSLDPGVRHLGVSSGSTGGRRTPVSGPTVLVANLLGHGDVPDSDLAELEWQLPPLSALALRSLIGGSVGQLESARVGPVVAASLHTLVNVGSRVAKWTRAQATLDTPDYKALLDIVDRNGLRTDLAHELGEATKMAQNEWRGEAPGSRVRGRDDVDPEEDPRAETRGRY